MAEAIYVRQSKDKKDSLSIEGQIERCKMECSHPDTALIYEDRGFSGKNTQRPGFQKMLKSIQAGKIEKIVVYRLDRLSRSILDFGQFWAELEQHHADFVSVNEKFDTTTPMGRAMIYIIMVFAQLERETIAERVTDNYYTRIKHGSWPGGPAPYGMRTTKIIGEDGKKIASLEYTEEFEIVKEIFHRYAEEDVSLGMIAKELTERGIPCNKRKGWDNVALSRILHSPVYVQADESIYHYYVGKGIKKFSNDIEDFDGTSSAHIVGKRTANERKYTSLEEHTVSLTNFEGRIPADIWLTCQRKLSSNRQFGNSLKGKNTWLTGLLKCGKCGYSLTVRKWNDKKYMYCTGKEHLHICDINKFTLRVTDIEKEVQRELELILDECNKEQVLIPEDDAISKLNKELQEIEEKIQRLVDSLKEASAISMKYINAELEKLDQQKNALIKNIEVPKQDQRRYFKGIVFEELSFEEKKMVVQAFIERINVFDDEIEIIWKI